MAKLPAVLHCFLFLAAFCSASQVSAPSPPPEDPHFSAEELEEVRKPLESAMRILAPIADLEKPTRDMVNSMQEMGEGMYKILEPVEQEMSAVPRKT